MTPLPALSNFRNMVLITAFIMIERRICRLPAGKKEKDINSPMMFSQTGTANRKNPPNISGPSKYLGPRKGKKKTWYDSNSKILSYLSDLSI